jgi:predicted RNA-binding protein
MVRHWFCITNPWNWFKVESNAIWGVDSRYEITLKRIEREDPMIFYCTNMPARLAQRLGLAGWRELSSRIASVETAVVGIYKAIGKCYPDNSDLGWLDRNGEKPEQNFPHRIKIASIYTQQINPIPLNFKSGRKLMEDLLFLPDKSKSYYNILYPSMLLIPEEDYITIKRYKEASPEVPKQT